jgi:hypothetical protein
MPGTIRSLLLACVLSSTLFAGCGHDKPKCKDGERTYEDGDSWTCADGCNYCECFDGEVRQTGGLCTEPPGPAAGKLACGSIARQHGSFWLCEDSQSDAGCEACWCDDGAVSRVRASCNAFNAR